MYKLKSLLLFAALALGAAGSAMADRGYHRHSGVHFGIVIGAPFYGPRYDYPPYYYPPVYPVAPVVVAPPVVAPPPVYIEQVSPAQGGNYWYYCAASDAYYPYVKDCPEGWQQVTPQAPR